MDAPRYIQIAHVIPGRARVRLPWLRQQPEAAAGINQALTRVPGVARVEVTQKRGSVLVEHDPARVDLDAILAAIKGATGVETVVQPGQQPPVEMVTGSLRGLVAKEVTELFQDINSSVLRTTHGVVDLGTLVAAGFATASAAKVIADRAIIAPQWFNMAWWAFRTFLTFEKDALEAQKADAELGGQATPS